MTTVDIAVLLEKAIILNGMIANPENAEQKRFARAEMEKILPKLAELAKYAHTDTLSRSLL